MIVWGSGKAMREFIYVDDMASASIHVLEMDKETYAANTQPMLSHINVGTGVDCTLRELAETIKRVVDFKGDLSCDARKPDGTPRKRMNVDRLKSLGRQAEIELEDGLSLTYDWYLQHSGQQDLRL